MKKSTMRWVLTQIARQRKADEMQRPTVEIARIHDEMINMARAALDAEAEHKERMAARARAALEAEIACREWQPGAFGEKP